MNASFKVVIPARYDSSRLPGKALLEIGDKPLIQHVYDSACQSSAEDIIIATDDSRIYDAAKGFGAKVVMTANSHRSGTERLNEVVTILNESEGTIIVNIQGDEFGLPPQLIDQVASNLKQRPRVAMATLCEKIRDKKIFNDPNAVKVVFDRDNLALYFSRAPIPASHPEHIVEESGCHSYRHMGIYAYRVEFLKQYTGLPHCCVAERIEGLEQLRALYYGFDIHVDVAKESGGIGVDTPADLELARKAEKKRSSGCDR